MALTDNDETRMTGYKAELERRIKADEAQAAADAREHGQREQPPKCAECAETGRTAYAIAAPDTDRPLCAKHGAQAAAAGSRYRQTQPHPTTPEATAGGEKETAMYTEDSYTDYSASDDDRETAHRKRFLRDTYTDGERGTYKPPTPAQVKAEQEDARQCAADEAERVRALEASEETKAPRFSMPPPLKVIPAPPDPRLQIQCPKCSSKPGDPCTSYWGKTVQPHRERKAAPLPAAAAAPIPTPPAPETAARPAPTPGKPDPRTARAVKPLAAIAAADLDAAALQMIATWGLPDSLDALWQADARRHPRA